MVLYKRTAEFHQKNCIFLRRVLFSLNMLSTCYFKMSLAIFMFNRNFHIQYPFLQSSLPVIICSIFPFELFFKFLAINTYLSIPNASFLCSSLCLHDPWIYLQLRILINMLFVHLNQVNSFYWILPLFSTGSLNLVYPYITALT